MSFRQDRTNPATAVSNWHGRSQTPKGWPSTRVSTWINGGLFSAGAAGWEVIATTVADSTTATYNFTSIPQTYRDLRLVVSAARTTSFGDRFYVYVDIGSGIDTDVADYGTRLVSNSSSSFGTMSVVNFSNLPGYATDFPGQPDTGVGMSAIWDWMDYANTTKLPTAIAWQNGQGQGTLAFYHVHGGWNYHAGVGAVQGLRITRPTTTSNYQFKEPTTFTLFGRGTAD